MSNVEKYIDRSPNIIPAGIGFKVKPRETVRDCLNIATFEDEMRRLKKDGNKIEYNLSKPLLQKRALKTEISKILQPPQKSQFEYLLEELKESSYLNDPVKKSGHKSPCLPQDLDAVNTTFGIESTRGLSVASLLNSGIAQKDDSAHELYKRSHLSYAPGEQLTRNYSTKSFDSGKRFGIHTSADYEGRYTARCLNLLNKNDLCIIGKLQGNFISRNRPSLGKVLEKNCTSTLIPEGHTFGRLSDRGTLGVEELLRDDQTVNTKKRSRLNSVIYLNMLRRHLKQRESAVCFQGLMNVLDSHDHSQTGTLPLQTVYKVCKCFSICPHEESIERLMKDFDILTQDGNVHYKRFVELINWKCEPPELNKIKDITEDSSRYETSYNMAVKDKGKIDSPNIRPAGIPSMRYDVPFPVMDTIVDRVHLVDETDVSALICPSIYTDYGLSHRDFFQPRKKNEIREIFQNVGVLLPDDKFEELWDEAYRYDQTGGVCVETFKNMLDKFSSK